MILLESAGDHSNSLLGTQVYHMGLSVKYTMNQEKKKGGWRCLPDDWMMKTEFLDIFFNIDHPQLSYEYTLIALTSIPMKSESGQP